MLWCDVYDAAGTKLSDGPVLLMNASYSRVLDGSGSFSIAAPLTDDYAVQQLQSQRRVYIYTDAPELRLIGAGIITRLSKKMGAGGWSLACDGPDLMYELKTVNTLLNKQFNQEYAVDAIDQLVGLKEGWRVEAEPDTTAITARFDGSSALKAMQAICEQTGLHFRYFNNRVVQTGNFAANAGVTLINPDSSEADSEHTAIIDSLDVMEESEDIVNWIVPMGSGEGEAALSLQYVFGTPVLSTYSETINGVVTWYMRDDASIALYGERQKVVKFDVSPLDNTVQSKARASNQLHAAAQEYLDKNSMPQITYRVVVRNLQKGVLPGDQVRLLYFGPIRRDDGTVIPDERIDTMLYVIKIEERHSTDDTTWTFEVSNIDRKLPTETDIVLNNIEKADVMNVKPALTPSVFTYAMSDVCSHIKAASFYLQIDSSITKIIQVRLRILTAPIYNLFVLRYATTPDIQGYFLPYVVNRYPIVSVSQSDASGDLFSASPIGSRTQAATAEYDITDYILNTIPANADMGFRFVAFDAVEVMNTGPDLGLMTPSAMAQWSASNVEVSGGVVYATFTVLAVTQAIRS